MSAPKTIFTWIMWLLLAALVALAGWIFWAVGKVEDAKREGGKPTVAPVAPAATGQPANATP